MTKSLFYKNSKAFCQAVPSYEPAFEYLIEDSNNKIPKMKTTEYKISSKLESNESHRIPELPHLVFRSTTQAQHQQHSPQ